MLLPPYMRNKKILIADNNDACRESLGVSIKGLGCEVVEAATGPEAIDKASFDYTFLVETIFEDFVAESILNSANNSR